MSDSDAVRQRLRDTFGSIDDAWEAAVDADAAYVQCFLDLHDAARAAGQLDEATHALILLAIHASVTTLHEPGIASAVALARSVGVPKAHVLETLQLVSVLGVHTVVIGMPALAEVLRDRHVELIQSGELSESQDRIKAKFESLRGYWSPLNEMLVRAAPTWFDAYTDFSAYPWVHGSLSPKCRELIYIAIDLAATHLFDTGVKPHIDNALKHGATAEEIVEVVLITASLGMASFAFSAQVVERTY